MYQACHNCSKRVKNSSELEHHIAKCHVCLCQQSQKISWNNVLLNAQSSSDCAESEDRRTDSSDFCDDWKSDAEEAADETQTQYDFLRSNTEGHTDLFDELINAVSDIEQMQEHLTQHSEEHDLLSISSSIWIETFQEGTDIVTEAVQCSDSVYDYQTDNIVSELNSESEAIDYYSFKNDTDYSWALWLHNSRTIKRSVNFFFNNSWLSQMHSLLSFRNEDQWLERLHWISHNIFRALKRQKWISQFFTIESVYNEVANCEYFIQYWSIIHTLHFLMSHKPFAEDLIYALIQHYNSDDRWTYNEMHTGDWWWETQKELLNDATLVLLLISTDKTALTQHQSDLSAWSVYLMIENLNWQMRQTQSWSSLVLLNFLPVIENDGDDIKSRVWHMTLNIIFDCKSRCGPMFSTIPTDDEQQLRLLQKMNLT